MRCMRPGRTGRGRSSPSLVSPDVAVTLKATVPTLTGAVMGKVRLVPPPFFTVKGSLAEAAARPNCGRRLSLVSGSRMSKVRTPERS